MIVSVVHSRLRVFEGVIDCGRGGDDPVAKLMTAVAPEKAIE